MAGNSWIDYGYGFCTTKIETTKERIEAFIAQAPLFKECTDTYFDAKNIKPELEDYMDLDAEDESEIAFIIQEVIKEQFNIELAKISDYNGEWYLLFLPGYPWEFKTEKERAVTKEYLDVIFTETIRMLTDNEIEIGFQAVENFD